MWCCCFFGPPCRRLMGYSSERDSEWKKERRYWRLIRVCFMFSRIESNNISCCCCCCCCFVVLVNCIRHFAVFVCYNCISLYVLLSAFGGLSAALYGDHITRLARVTGSMIFRLLRGGGRFWGFSRARRCTDRGVIWRGGVCRKSSRTRQNSPPIGAGVVPQNWKFVRSFGI